MQGAALVMGFALARTITGSVHELFAGTERVRRGDFAHRIRIASGDQLGDLADSFNAMTASVEGLLAQAAEKKRLEEELRIARDMQMSLLPRDAASIPGLTVAPFSRPAREVGGDYYDVVRLGERKLGVLVADVSREGRVGSVLHGRAQGARAGPEPHLRVAPALADGGQSHLVSEPRRAELHHDDLRRHRSPTGGRSRTRGPATRLSCT